MKLKTKYSCKNCGKIYYINEPDGWKQTKKELICALDKADESHFTKIIVHECENGEIGISDVIGMALEKE